MEPVQTVTIEVPFTIRKRGGRKQVITPDVLERTFGARMEVLEHLGMRVVVDEAPSHGGRD